MNVSLPSFAKINLGLRIGRTRGDGFHELRTIYQTIALHDVIRVRIERGSGIEIRCDNLGVPKDESNTCSRIIQQARTILNFRGRVVIDIEKRLPIQGGLGGASGNAVTALLALERALKKKLSVQQKLRIAAAAGSDIPLFLIGGTILGTGRGEEVFPLIDLPSIACVIALPDIAVSTPGAFEQWDKLCEHEQNGVSGIQPAIATAPLTHEHRSDRLVEFSRLVSAWLNARPGGKTGRALSGVPGNKRGGRAEILLLDLVRTGIENDFEKVVFPQYPELREVKRALELAGATYGSLSGSGSAVYGLFSSTERAARAGAKLRKAGIPAVATRTLTRSQYWRKLLASGL